MRERPHAAVGLPRSPRWSLLNAAPRAIFALFIAIVFAACCSGAVLKGSVVDNVTGRPLARARVSLQPLPGTTGTTASDLFSDSYGRFEFVVAAGSYLMTATRQNYAVARYGAQTWKAAGTPIVLGQDSLFVAEIRLRRLAVITGEVWDENHLGITGVPVYAYRVGKRLSPAAHGESDDRGVYRIAGLYPGRYYIRTAGKSLEAKIDLLPTWYGQAARVVDARVVEAHMEEESSGIHIEPSHGRLSTLDISCSPIESVGRITLFTDFGKKEQTIPCGTAIAHFAELAPGAYYARAEATTKDGPIGVLQTVSVWQNQSATLHMYRLSPVILRCHGEDGRPVASAEITAQSSLPGDEASLALNCSNSITVSPGIWDLHGITSDGDYLTRVAYGSVRDRPLSISTATHPMFELVFSSASGSLSGTVKTAAGEPAFGAPVFLTPSATDMQSILQHGLMTTADENGKFNFGKLPPGQYEIISSLQLMPDPTDPDWAPPSGISVLVEAGSKKTVDIGPTELPDVF